MSNIEININSNLDLSKLICDFNQDDLKIELFEKFKGITFLGESGNINYYKFIDFLILNNQSSQNHKNKLINLKNKNNLSYEDIPLSLGDLIFTALNYKPNYSSNRIIKNQCAVISYFLPHINLKNNSEEFELNIKNKFLNSISHCYSSSTIDFNSINQYINLITKKNDIVFFCNQIKNKNIIFLDLQKKKYDKILKKLYEKAMDLNFSEFDYFKIIENKSFKKLIEPHVPENNNKKTMTCSTYLFEYDISDLKTFTSPNKQISTDSCFFNISRKIDTLNKYIFHKKLNNPYGEDIIYDNDKNFDFFISFQPKSFYEYEKNSLKSMFQINFHKNIEIYNEVNAKKILDFFVENYLNNNLKEEIPYNNLFSQQQYFKLNNKIENLMEEKLTNKKNKI